MDRILMIGTGSGGTIDLYNTCFLIQSEISFSTRSARKMQR